MLPRIWPVLRLAVALLILAAVVAQLVRTIGNAMASETEHGSHLLTVATNFLSFFTIQSNVLAAVVLLIGAVWVWKQGSDAAHEPRWFAALLACATTYMLVTGVVYNVLLRGIELPQGQTVWWSNEVLHLVAPLFLLADLFFAPKRRALGWPTIAVVLAYPIVWIVYTLVRGPLIIAPGTGNPGWYPYPFLDPNGPGGKAAVVFYIALIAGTIAVVAAGVIWVGRRRDRLAHAASDRTAVSAR